MYKVCVCCLFVWLQSGQTACGVADRLGYIGVVEALRPVTEHTVSQSVGDSGNAAGIITHSLLIPGRSAYIFSLVPSSACAELRCLAGMWIVQSIEVIKLCML